MYAQLQADHVLAQRDVARQVRQAVRGRPAKGARRQLWKRDVKQWLQMHDRGADWELPAAERRQLVEWFNALDVDGSGSVEVEEIKALMSAVGARCTQAMLISMFASVQKHIGDELAPWQSSIPPRRQSCEDCNSRNRWVEGMRKL